MLRTVRLISAVALTLTACVDEPDDPEVTASESELGFPDSNPAHTQVASANGTPGGCLDLPLGLPAGQPLILQQFPCNAGDNQRWRFVPVATGVFRIHSSRDPGLCLDLPSSNAVSGQDLQLFPCNGGNNQLWFVNPLAGGVAQIKSILNLFLCVDVENAVVNNPATVQLFTCKPAGSNANQLWKFRTWLGNDSSVDGCNGNVRFGAGGPTTAPSAVNSFRVFGNTLTSLCQVGPLFPTDTVQCPAGTNWMVPDRRVGTGNFPVACFRE